VFGAPVHRSHDRGKDIQACGVPKGIIGSIRFTQITMSPKDYLSHRFQ
jgi:hypothetical protein